MKLICEILEKPTLVVEAAQDGKKSYYIEGIFLQGKVKNKNGRVYPVPILEREIRRYQDEYIKKNRAYGELGHPNGPQINLDRVSHMIKSIRQDGPNFIGKAKIIEANPCGLIVKNLLDEGAQIAVSSRGMGNLRDCGGYQEVTEDYYLVTAADIVADPSAPAAFVNGIMEGREWVWNNGIFKEAELAAAKVAVDRAARRGPAASAAMQARVFESFLANL